MITFESSGSWGKTDSFLAAIRNKKIYAALDRYGKQGVSALASATPVETGVSAQSWSYKVEHASGQESITWYNSHTHGGLPIVVLLQYGHGTGTGGYVQGRDFINPALRPIFDKIADEVWKAVTSA